MGLKLFSCQGGDILLPDKNLVLVSRQDGGNLVVTPPRDVWERSELSAIELMLWSFLVAAAGRAMLDVLPQLEGGCINYWEAGNWALNKAADPSGAKTAKEYRHVHLHLLGRSPNAADPAWRWGEAPKFPDYAERHSWAANNKRLSAEECHIIVANVEIILQNHYGMPSSYIAPWFKCGGCGYPVAGQSEVAQNLCPECQPAA